MQSPPADSASVVSVRSAVCVLGNFPALAGADLDVRAGEIVHLSGPNGAGKSTLLRLLAGILPLRSGSVTVLGHDLSGHGSGHRTAHRRSIALVGHETFCYDDLTVTENLQFACDVTGGDRRRIDTAIEQMGLRAIAQTQHSKLSAGQRRRLALAVALTRDAKLWLLDEPHAGLDSDGRALLDGIVSDAPRRGVTVLFASHELDRARAIATREVRVELGRVHDVPGADT